MKPIRLFRSETIFALNPGFVAFLIVFLLYPKAYCSEPSSIQKYAERTTPSFVAAKPIWPKGKETEMNLTTGFRTVFHSGLKEQLVLRVTGSSIYRIYLNGTFIGYGPARGPRDYYRVDEWALDPALLRDQNLIAIEVAGYNINSYYLLDQPSFLQAEVVSGEEVLAATGKNPSGFEALLPKDRNQKVERYNFQRMFMESYQLMPGYDDWKKELNWSGKTVECAVQENKNFLPRRVAYPRFHVDQPVQIIAKGEMKRVPLPDKPWRVMGHRSIGPGMKGYTDDEITHLPAVEIQSYATATSLILNEHYEPDSNLGISGMGYRVFDMGTNLTGFIDASFSCEVPTRLIITFDEILTHGDVDYMRYKCDNLIELNCAPGNYDFESMEPYTLQYMKVIVLEGKCTLNGLSLREYTTPDVWEADFAASDPKLNDIFDAARETYRQNAVDIFMDCPSRERAGWLCDSYFTARVAQDLSGHCHIEKNFLENFLLPDTFRYMPKGMIPPCYPADQTEHRFIPNWAMFFVLQLEEYDQRTGDTAFVQAFEKRVMELLDYFKDFENEDGLLENLQSWVFVEHSKANDFVQDVNYPSNALYAQTLEVAGRLFHYPELEKKAEAVRKVIRAQSYDGTFFVDNAVREKGKLKVTGNHTEVCQYYMFYFNVATLEKYPELFEKLRTNFGPNRDPGKVYPKVWPANAFIGNYLRLELLSRFGDCHQIEKEIVDFFYPMSVLTGTLWEHMGTQASCNHGFASHTAHSLYRDVLGIYKVDQVIKHVVFRFSDVGLDWCRGRRITENGAVELNWRKEGDTLYYSFRIPAGYSLSIENNSSLKLSEL